MVDKVVTERFGVVLKKGQALLNQHIRYSSGYEFADPQRFSEWRNQSLTLLQWAYGDAHPYVTSFEHETTPSGFKTPMKDNAQAGLGTLSAAAEDYEAGFARTFRELVHADVFDDLLEMAHALLLEGYKDASAVIAGSTLEEHLRKLCNKHLIPTETVKPNGSVETRKAAVLNNDLKQQPAYNQIEWRSVQEWLDVRNAAAHGHYGDYTIDQVKLMIDGLRGFFIRHPA